MQKQFGSEAVQAASWLDAQSQELLDALQNQSGVSPITLLRIHSLSRDVTAASRTVLQTFAARLLNGFEEVARTATMTDAELNEDHRIHSQIAYDLSYEAAAAMKAFMLFVRAYQDAICAAGIELMGDRVSKGSSMRGWVEALRCVGHVKLCQPTPGYAEWFIRMRDLRNQLKYGQSVWWEINTATGDEPPYIRIWLSTPAGDKLNMGLEDVVEALIMSAAVSRNALAWASDASKRTRSKP